MSQFWLAYSCLFGTLDPCSLGDAPLQSSYYFWTLTLDVTSIEVHANESLASEALRGSLGGILPANCGQRHQVGPVE